VTRHRSTAILVALCASYAIYCLATRPPGAFTSPDSEVYLAFSPIVPTGYPAFLRVFGERGALLVQPVTYAAALGWLGTETLFATSSMLLSTAVVIASIAVPELTTYHASILTESLFMSGLVGFLAAVIRFVRTSSPSSAAAAATIAGLATTLRSTGYAFVPILIVMVLMQRRRLGGRAITALLAATLPMLMLAGGERIAARAVHGDRLTSLTGRHLFAKAGLIDAPPPAHSAPDAVRARLEHELDVTFAPIRGFIDRAPREVRAILTLYYEGCLQGPCVAELGESRPGSEDPQLADALAQVGRERIMRAPLHFARLTATDYASLWTAYKQHHPDTAQAMNALIAANRPLPFERESFRLRGSDAPGFQPYAAVRYVQPIVIALGLLTGGLSLVALAAGLSGRLLPLPLAIACLAALTAHAGLLFSAAFAAGIARFIVALWPAITTAALFAVYAVVPARSETRVGSA
jgi:hypothetical protein